VLEPQGDPRIAHRIANEHEPTRGDSSGVGAVDSHGPPAPASGQPAPSEDRARLADQILFLRNAPTCTATEYLQLLWGLFDVGFSHGALHGLDQAHDTMRELLEGHDNAPPEPGRGHVRVIGRYPNSPNR
jgi:hypothetical protein